MAEHECKDCKNKKVDKDDIRLDISNKFYEKIDNLIDESFKEDNISYGEIELAFLKMNEKITQQKIALMYQYLQSEDSNASVPDKKEPSDMYG